MPVSLTSEIARLENVDGQRMHDLDMAKKVWLIHCPGPTFNISTVMTWKD